MFIMDYEENAVCLITEPVQKLDYLMMEKTV